MRFRRKGEQELPAVDDTPDESVDDAQAADPAATDEASRGATGEATGASRPGPRDSAEVEDDGVERVDLGSLRLSPVGDLELRLQVDETSGQVQSAMIVGPDGAVDLRAFAAPRHGDLWDQTRSELAAEAAQRGGTVEHRTGRLGEELVMRVPAKTPDGQTGTQLTRVVGVNGDRWMLRATFLGRPAIDPDGASRWDEVLDAVVVHRGAHAMPVGDALPLQLPPGAQRVR